MNETETIKRRVSFILISLACILIFLLLEASTSPAFDQAKTLQDQPTPTPTLTRIITISGTVTDTGGQPLHSLVSVNSGAYEPLGNVLSNLHGKYSIQVPGRKGYIVNAQAVDVRVTFGEDMIPSYYMDQNQAVMSTKADELIVNFSMKPAGAIWLQTYDLNGNYLFRQDVNNNNWNVGIYPLGEIPTSHSLQYLNHQENTFWGWRNGSDKNHPVLLVPPEEPVELWIHFDVPEVGNTYIHLDNDGKGYTVKQGEVIKVNFLYDAAKTEYRQYKERIDQYLSEGYIFTEDIAQWNSEAGQILENMTSACQAENFGTCISDATTMLSRTFKSREDAIFQVAQQDIEKFKKMDISLRVNDCSGKSISGLVVDFQQKTNDFIFGVGWPENNQLVALKETGFNGAIKEAWWGEVTIDGVNYDFREDQFTPITQQGMDIVMHTGVWITPITNPNWYFFPRMIFKLTPAEIGDLARNFSSKVTEHFRDRMSIFDVFNEPQNAFYTLHLTMDDVVNIASASAEGARQGAPNVPTYINFYYAYLGEMSWYINANNETFPTPEEILKAILQKQVPFDNIGLEFYNSPSIDFGIYDDTIEHYSKFGKSIFVSELSFSGNWRDAISNQTAAQWAEYAYTIAFSKPYVTGIVWIPGNGPENPAYLFQQNGDPRPTLDTIGKLIHNWRTSGKSTTDEQGVITWRGFAGDYDIHWIDPNGSEQTLPVHVTQNGKKEFILQSNNCSAAATSSPTTTTTLPPKNGSKPNSIAGSIPMIAIGIGAGFVLLLIALFLLRRKSG